MGDRFYHAIGELASPPYQPLQQPLWIREVRKANIAGCERPDRPGIRVIGQTLTDAGTVDNRGDTDAA